jgi:hypothetical protein
MSASKRPSTSSLRRFITSRPYVTVAELRRRFGIDDPDAMAHIRRNGTAAWIGLPEREASKLQELWARDELGVELSVEVRAPVVVGVYPLRIAHYVTHPGAHDESRPTPGNGNGMLRGRALDSDATRPAGFMAPRPVVAAQESVQLVAIVTTDLMTAAPILDAASVAGHHAVRLDHPRQLPLPIEVRIAFVDWGCHTDDWADALQEWQTAANGSAPRIVVFGPHADLDAHRTARDAGIGPMTARSQLFSRLGAYF